MHSWDVLYCTLRKKSGEREKREEAASGRRRRRAERRAEAAVRAVRRGLAGRRDAEDRLASSAVGVFPEVLAATAPGVHLG